MSLQCVQMPSLDLLDSLFFIFLGFSLTLLNTSLLWHPAVNELSRKGSSLQTVLRPGHNELSRRVTRPFIEHTKAIRVI